MFAFTICSYFQGKTAVVVTTTEGSAELNVFLMNTTIIIIVIYVGHIGAANQNKDGNAFTQRRARSTDVFVFTRIEYKKSW